MRQKINRFSVRIHEMAHYADPSEEWEAACFSDFDTAREFARRWTRHSLEELRPNASSDKDLKDLWFLFGDDASVIGANEVYHGVNEIDFFISHPASPDEVNWKELKIKDEAS